MIITQTPMRMSFFGGGTDFPEFFNKYSGAVISTTFDKYCHLSVCNIPNIFDYNTYLSYAKIERVNSNDEIEHPAIRNAMNWLGLEKIYLDYSADLPAKTGLGTSSSFSVGMLNAFYTLNGISKTKRELADDAIYLERTLCNEDGGYQDQIAAAFGGFNRIDFSSGGYNVSPIIISEERKKELNDNLMLFFTGLSRYSFQIQKNVKKILDKRVPQLLEMLAIVDEVQIILENENRSLDEFGKLLNETWMIKKSISDEISTEYVDAYYNKAISAGALGGKLLGAGGGGCLVFYAKKEKQPKIREALKDLHEIKFKFESKGTTILCAE